MVAPVSACTNGTNSSLRAIKMSAARFSSAGRSSGVTSATTSGNASLAAAAAASASEREHSGALPTTCSVAGLTTS